MKNQISLRKEDMVRIENDAAMAHPTVGSGRLLPVVLADTTRRPDLEELIRLHKFVAPGDCNYRWARLKGPGKPVVLLLDFERPVDVTAALVFDLPKRAGLVDLVLRSGAMYLVSARPGDRFRDLIDDPRILIDVGSTGFEAHWEKVFLEVIAEEFRTDLRSRRRARAAAREAIGRMRQLGDFRMRSSPE